MHLQQEMKRLLATAGMHLRADSIPANPFAGLADRITRDGWMGVDGAVVSRADAIAFERHLEHLSTQAHLAVYPDLSGTMLLPLAPDQPPPGATSYAWPEVEMLVGGSSGSGYSGLGPAVEVNASKESTPIGTFTSHYGYDIGEQQRAKLGYPLESLKGVAARRIIEQDINTAIWTGDTKRGLPGVLTDANIVKTNVAVGASLSRLWANKEADEIQTDVQTEVTAIEAATKGNKALRPNRLALPSSRYSQLAMMKRSNGTDITVLQFLQMVLAAATQQTDFQITSHSEMETGAGGGSDAWGLLYRFDPMVAGRIMALPFSELAPQQIGFGYIVPCHAQAGGVAVFKPLAMRILYGI